ncbi:GAF domain-containing protein [Aliterella atlantica]|uniref:GAF domain-containing protein n=1 Tax=Aliterella atlantica TaxID=1827278 RepID=UPI0005D45F32|nr:GAF domain-containing protein [Aliterella atlantica]
MSQSKAKTNQLQTIETAIREASDFQDALQVTLQKVCESSAWEYGEAWIPTSDGILALSPVWYSDPDIEALEKFRLCSEAFILSANTGLPGRVWSSKQPEWIEDVGATSETYFLRNQIAKACSVKAGFGIPITTNDEVIAVIVFFMRQAQAENPQLIELVKAAATQLEQILLHSSVSDRYSSTENI